MTTERFVVTEQMTTGHLEPFTAQTAGLVPDSGIPTNLVSGANYAVVEGPLVAEYDAGRFDVENQEPDGFVLVFPDVVPPVRIASRKKG